MQNRELSFNATVTTLCDYSLASVKSRPAVVGETLETKAFGMGTRGFCSTQPGETDTVVCLLPGTELSFADPVAIAWGTFRQSEHKTAIFRQVDKEMALTHHDTLEFPDGTSALLTHLVENQKATVLQLPAAPKNEAEAEEQRRVEVVA